MQAKYGLGEKGLASGALEHDAWVAMNTSPSSSETGIDRFTAIE